MCLSAKEDGQAVAANSVVVSASPCSLHVILKIDDKLRSVFLYLPTVSHEFLFFLIFMREHCV